MNINTNHPFGGKHFTGIIRPKWFQKELPGIYFQEFGAGQGQDKKCNVSSLLTANTSELVEMRDELNELIMFMTSLEPGKEKSDEMDTQTIGEIENTYDKGFHKVIEGCQRCGKTHFIHFMPLLNPIDSFNMWGICLKTGQPVLLCSVQSDEKKQDGDEKMSMCTICLKKRAEGSLHNLIRKNFVLTCSDCGNKACDGDPVVKYIPFGASKATGAKPICEYCKTFNSDGVCYPLLAPDVKRHICRKCFNDIPFKETTKFEAYGENHD